jgi:hypothetical protein
LAGTFPVRATAFSATISTPTAAFARPPNCVASSWRCSPASSPEQVVMSCGSGVTACHNLLAMAIAGLPGARLYAGFVERMVQRSGAAGGLPDDRCFRPVGGRRRFGDLVERQFPTWPVPLAGPFTCRKGTAAVAGTSCGAGRWRQLVQRRLPRQLVAIADGSDFGPGRGVERRDS